MATKIRIRTTPDPVVEAIKYLLDHGGELRKEKPLSERQMVEETIAFANSGDAIHIISLYGGFQTELKIGDAFIAPWLSESERSWVRDNLRKVVSGQVDDTMLDEVTKTASRMIQLPKFVINDSTLQVAHHYLCENFIAPMAYAILLMLDQSRPFFRSLCQCQLHACSRFFFAYKPPTGRPRTRYCSDVHMLEAHAAESSQRVAASRKNRKKLKSIPRPRKSK